MSVGGEGLPLQCLGEIGGEQDAGEVRAKLLDEDQCLEASQLVHMHVEQHEINRVVLDDLDRLLGTFDRQDQEVRFENDLQRLPKAAIIVGNQNSVVAVERRPFHARGRWREGR